MAHAQENDILLAAISDVQETIRAFDLKAEILTGILTFVVGLVAFGGHEPTQSWLHWVSIAAVVAAFVAMGCLAAVLYPSNNPIAKLKLGTFKPSGTFYITDTALANESVSDLSQKVAGTTWTDELVYELVKVSSIRSRKTKWFVRAVVASAAAFGLLSILCLVRFS